MEPDRFDKHIPELIGEQEKEKYQSKTVKPDPVRVTINVPLGEPVAGPAAAAPPAPPPAPPRIAAPAVRPRTFLQVQTKQFQIYLKKIVV